FGEGFPLERSPKCLHRRVVIAVAFAAHARNQTMGLEFLPVSCARVLHAPIRMMNHPTRITSFDEASFERLDSSSVHQTFPNGPTEDLAAVKIHHRSDKQPAFVRGHISDVRHPDLIGLPGR